MEIYIVKPGDSVYKIAEKYGVSYARLAYDNQLGGQRYLVPGQALVIRIPKTIHTVKRGETLEQIAETYQVPEKRIYQNNLFLLNQNYLLADQKLVIAYEESGDLNYTITGYAYPYIPNHILEEALLYIDDLLVFSYGFTESGELIPPQVTEDWMLRRAYQFEVRPILVLTPFSEAGIFNNQLITALIQNPETRKNLISNLLDKVKEKGYQGVDVDFEYILPEDKVGYAEFVAELRQVMNANGYTVSVALAPKTSAEQKGILYEGVDYAALGAAADSVFLMTYEWGYTYGPPMAVAPIHKVREVVDYAVTEIPREKILMGIPNYGYDWTLPFQKGISKARLIGNVEAVQIAAENGAQIQFDEQAQSPYFRYWKERVQHEVWFEDVRSIQEKIKLVREYGLRGFGYWNLMRPFRGNWMLLL